jgi:hypothetical protein
MEDYIRRSQAFQKRLEIHPVPRKEARYLLFRMACPLMQAKLPKLIDVSKIPVTFVHGNPHLDNYVRTSRGSAMMDFDRSRMGPYAWDIIRFLASLSLKREDERGFLYREVVEHFIDSYMTHFLNPDTPSKQLKLLKNVKPDDWQLSTRKYLASDKRWAKKMREHLLNPKADHVVQLLEAFLSSRNELQLLKEFKISEVGHTPGTFGKKHFIYSLIPKDPDSHLDDILLDIKEVYTEKNTRWFYSPVPHHGLRMIEAANIYAPGMEERLGYCTVNNRQYWGRQIPPFAVKVKKYLDKGEQIDFAYSVASELAKGHRKGLKDPKHAELIERDFTQNFDKYYKVSKLLCYELKLAFEAIRLKIQLYQDYRDW